MKYLIIILLSLTMFSCINEDGESTPNYNSYIEMRNNQLINHSYDVLAFKSTVTNRSTKDLTISVKFNIKIGEDRYFGAKEIKGIRVNSGETKIVYSTFHFQYFDYLRFEPRDLVHFVDKIH